MKKGIYYLPLLLILLINIGFTIYLETWYCFTGWVLSFLFLCEIYYLRFLK
jgi:hypothetical protein